ncbi:MAG: tetratricopeptide repeat protein [Bacteroidota bacterium]
MSSPFATADALQRSADLLAQERPEAARALLVDLLAEAPLHATAQMLLAKACEATGDLQAALAAWHQAHFLVPTSPVVQRERQRLSTALAARVSGQPSTLPQPLVPPVPRRDLPLPPVETDDPLFDFDQVDVLPETVLPDPTLPEVEGGASQESAPTPAVPIARDEPVPSLDFDNLDALIEQLEQAPRIVPDPDFEVQGAPPAADDAIADDMVSETLARIFVAQDRIDEAIEVYETLAEREPERRSVWLTEAETLRQRYNRPADDA